MFRPVILFAVLTLFAFVGATVLAQLPPHTSPVGTYLEVLKSPKPHFGKKVSWPGLFTGMVKETALDGTVKKDHTLFELCEDSRACTGRLFIVPPWGKLKFSDSAKQQKDNTPFLITGTLTALDHATGSDRKATLVPVLLDVTIDTLPSKIPSPSPSPR